MIELEEVKEALMDTNNLKPLQAFAFLPKFDQKIEYLASIAEPEDWSFHDDNNLSYPVLYHYVHNTFTRALQQEKIMISTDKNYACFNTGLMSVSGEDIYAFFNKNKNYPEKPCYWYLVSFYKESDRELITVFKELPDIVTYTDNINELYFNPTYDIVLNWQHILTDNEDRLPDILRQLDSQTVVSILNGVVQKTKKYIQRNHQFIIPQYYKEKINFLLPIFIGNQGFVLALENINNNYRANTCLTLDMAYCNARLIMKPAVSWLNQRASYKH